MSPLRARLTRAEHGRRPNLAAGAHAAPIQLPQVNDDPANSISPTSPRASPTWSAARWSKKVSVRLTHPAIVRVHRAHRLAIRITAAGRSRAAIVRA